MYKEERRSVKNLENLRKQIILYLSVRERAASIMWFVFSGIHLAGAAAMITYWAYNGPLLPEAIPASVAMLCYLTLYGVWFLFLGFNRRKLLAMLLSPERALLSDYGYGRRKYTASVISLAVCCISNLFGIAGFSYDLATYRYIKNHTTDGSFDT